MTTLTLSISRSLARSWESGDQIVVTRLDHDANISPWLMAAEDRGVEVKWLDFDPSDCTLALDDLGALLSERTRLVAINYASNAVGTISDVARAARIAREAGALSYVDAVHYAPHGPIDVQALGCDFLVSSPYKYFGPHSGVLWGRLGHLAELEAYKVRPAPAEPPGKWETGTQSFEAIAGIRAAIEYLAELISDRGDRRGRLVEAMSAVAEYEHELSARFLDGADQIAGLRVHGITARDRLSERTPTFAVSLDGWTPQHLSQRLGERGFFTWSGHYYAVEVMRRLGVLDSGGLLRIGFVHYNTTEEVDGLLELLDHLAREAA
jgi:cysteine desulfurase family protein (TIGR01976 family)